MSNYRFSPSRLDKFQYLLDAEAYFESDRNQTDDGPRRTLEEITAEREQELLDAINEVPREPAEAASRGTAFNELVDAIIRAKNAGIDLIYSTSEKVKILLVDHPLVECECEGFRFCFDYNLAEAVADRLLEGTMQLHVQAPLLVDGHEVLLHGYPDYIMPNGVIDLKTTATWKRKADGKLDSAEGYIFGKYANYWQRYTYPYILQATGMLTSCIGFEFLVVEFGRPDKEKGMLSGTIYEEDYTRVDMECCRHELEWICRGFIAWLEDHRDQITNKKIFCNDDTIDTGAGL